MGIVARDMQVSQRVPDSRSIHCRKRRSNSKLLILLHAVSSCAAITCGHCRLFDGQAVHAHCWPSRRRQPHLSTSPAHPSLSLCATMYCCPSISTSLHAKSASQKSLMISVRALNESRGQNWFGCCNDFKDAAARAQGQQGPLQDKTFAPHSIAHLALVCALQASKLSIRIHKFTVN